MGVATAVAIGGLAISAATTVKSFSDANKSRKLQRQAEADAQAAMAEARKKLEINVYDTLAIQKEPYELEREAMLVQGAQAMEAAKEAEQRGVAATAGRLQMAQNVAQADIRTRMGQELLDIEKLKADEESRLRDLGVQLDVGAAEGAQAAAANYEQRAAMQTEQGFQGAASMLQQGLGMFNLYSGGGKTTTTPTNTPVNSSQGIRGGATPSSFAPSLNLKTQPISSYASGLNMSAGTPNPFSFGSTPAMGFGAQPRFSLLSGVTPGNYPPPPGGFRR